MSRGTFGSLAAAAIVLFLQFTGPESATGQTFINPAIAPEAPPARAIASLADLEGMRLDTREIGMLTQREALFNEEQNRIATFWSAHANYGRTHFDEFVQAYELFRTEPQRALQRAQAGDSAFISALLSDVAVKPIDARESLDQVPLHRNTVARAQRRLVALHRSANEVITGLPIVVFATGTARETLRADDDPDAGTPIATGSLGAQIGLPNATVTAMVNIIGNDEPRTRNFGEAVLSPMAGGTLAGALFDYRMNHGLPAGFLPQHYYVSVASSRWRPQENVAAVAATVLGLGFLYSGRVVNTTLLENSVSLTVELGPTFRYIGGDADRSSAVSEVLNGIHSVYGLETGFSLTFGRVMAAAQMYILEAGKVDRLHGLNMVAGLSVSGEFIRGRLPR